MEPAADASPDLAKKPSDAEASGSASSISRKSAGSKESGSSILNSVNKHTSQIKKPPHRRSASPLNWFPRKKTESYLKRKIRLLQEAGGMSSSLDEVLDDANPHYSRMMREKIAAKDAANKAMEAHKAAMVEASWCRILQAARIQCKKAEAELEKADKHMAEAFEAATAVGVMMYDTPDCPRRPCEIKTSSAIGGRSTHTVTASLETAFEVDKEVSAAVKKAFIRLASCPSSSNKEEFRDLLHKISQNPDNIETNQESAEISSECESDSSSELEDVQNVAECVGANEVRKSDIQGKHRKYNIRSPSIDLKKRGSGSSEDLVSKMLDRLKCLQEDQLASLAVIVATCGLSAALREVDGGKNHGIQTSVDCNSGAAVARPRSMSSAVTGARRYSTAMRYMKKEAATELPSLDKFLVKHVSKLEREVQEARNLQKADSLMGNHRISSESSRLRASEGQASDSASDLGSFLVKHVPRLERDIQRAKSSQKGYQMVGNEKGTESGSGAPASEPILHQGEALLQHSNVESGPVDESHNSVQPDKENIEFNTSSITEEQFGKGKPMSRIERAKLEAWGAFSHPNGEQTGLDKILVKPVHRLEKEKTQALEQQNRYTVKKDNQKQMPDASESLDKVLVKHVSRLEKERLACRASGEDVVSAKCKDQQFEKNTETLDQILVKHQFKLERAKLAASKKSEEHISGEDEVCAKRKDKEIEKSTESLDQILVKHQSILEKAKLAAYKQSEYHIKLVNARKESRERELQEAWGGLSLGNSMKPHLSRLERDKAAWRQAEEEQKQAE